MTAENHKPRLRRLELVYPRAPRYFITACTHNRRHILANPFVHESFLRFAQQGSEHGAWIGAYVFMPDHVHAFVAIDNQKLNLSAWGKSFKNSISKTLRQTVLLRRIGKRRFSIISFAAQSPTRRNGITFGTIPYEQGLSAGGKIGRSKARSSRWNIGL
jgi:REP element-mobilizing transposase RayT